jgi:hypothetical protein
MLARRAAVPFALSIALLLGAIAPRSALHVVGRDAPTTIELQQSIAYLVLSPAARVLDELSLLEANQHVALGVSVVCLTIALGLWRARRQAPPFGRARAALLPPVVGLLGLAGTYAVGALAPRPMVAVAIADSNIVVVDLHSHTRASHDGRWDFTVEDNRRWHADAGFDAAYVTDHQTMNAWRELADRGRLGEVETAEASVLTFVTGRRRATTILPGVETHVPGLHINILGVGAEHASLLTDRREVDTLGLAQLPRHATAPLVMATTPFDTARFSVQSRYVDAIELSDASPRGLEFGRVHRARLIAAADSLGVPLVASSNLHGWGRTAAAWTLVRIANWRQLQPLALDTAIRVTLRTNPRAVTVVERDRLPASFAFVAQATVLPRLGIHIFRSLSSRERFAGLAWIWLIFAWRQGRASSGTFAARRRILGAWTLDSKAR